VNAGATLGGAGIVSRPVVVTDGAALAPGNLGAGVLATSNLVMSSGALLDVEIGLSVTDRVTVAGNLTLDGAVNVTALSGFGVGTHTLLTYTGALVDNGLTIGAFPDGFSGEIQTGGGSVRLVVSGPPDNDHDGDPDVTDPDDDNDGIPDVWELAYGLDPFNAADALLDSDRDGVLNLDEYVANTVPTNEASYFRIEGIYRRPDTEVEFLGVSGRVYVLERTAVLTNPASWTPKGTNVPMSNGVTSIPDAETGDIQFYRLKVHLPP
jgi:hypothetical protein